LLLVNAKLANLELESELLVMENYFSAGVSAKTVSRAVLDDGYAVVENLAPDLTIQAGRELQPHIDQASFGHTEFLGARTRRISALPKRSSAAQQLIVHDLVLGVCDQILLSQCAKYQLNFTGVMQLHPGAEEQVLHRDGLLYPFRNPHPATMVQAMWAVSDFSSENGGTNIVPRSNHWEDQRWPEEHEVISAEMPKGSVLFYQSGTIHGAGANNSTSLRTGISIQYSLGWLRTEENQHLTNPPDIAKSFPEMLQKLVGYEFGGPYLGFVDGDDPKWLLREKPENIPFARSRQDIDEAAEKLPRFRFGDIEPTPTPKGRKLKAVHVPDTATKRTA
jgi:ectoine hydroxylase-related dioxygenase (phytanoyl-CoA dioxygenase family)